MLTIDPKREARATSNTTKPRGTSTRNWEWKKTFAVTRAAVRLRRAPVIGRPTTTSLVRIDVTGNGYCGGSDALDGTVRILGPILSTSLILDGHRHGTRIKIT
jgi:hypothetical protein